MGHVRRGTSRPEQRCSLHRMRLRKLLGRREDAEVMEHVDRRRIVPVSSSYKEDLTKKIIHTDR